MSQSQQLNDESRGAARAALMKALRDARRALVAALPGLVRKGGAAWEDRQLAGDQGAIEGYVRSVG